MPREVDPSLNERQFFAKALQENIRLDGRSFDQYRALELDFGDELGVVDVRLGKTRYVMLAFLFPRVFQFMPCVLYTMFCIFIGNYITKLNPSLTPP